MAILERAPALNKPTSVARLSIHRTALFAPGNYHAWFLGGCIRRYVNGVNSATSNYYMNITVGLTNDFEDRSKRFILSAFNVHTTSAS